VTERKRVPEAKSLVLVNVAALVGKIGYRRLRTAFATQFAAVDQLVSAPSPDQTRVANTIRSSSVSIANGEAIVLTMVESVIHAHIRRVRAVAESGSEVYA